MGKVYFDDSGKAVKKAPKEAPQNSAGKVSKKRKREIPEIPKVSADVEKKWHQIEYSELSEIKEMKDSEQNELSKKCQTCFEAEVERQQKNNPSDAKWLETALHRGTAKDRANAGALLVQSNPLPNLPALETLIGQTKLSNKSSPEVLEIVAELFMTSLIPKDRKLFSLNQRGEHWKQLKKADNPDKDKIYAYWQFEENLRQIYFTFLQTLQTHLQNGKENNKSAGMRVASRLLAHGPEKESFLLSILVNKLGDPDHKIASKASYRLTEVLRQHPNMTGVVVVETEKLLFRNNVSESAQHFALSFLTTIARYADAAASIRLAKICFAFFKIKIERGEINTKTMKSILLCLRTALAAVETDAGVEQSLVSEGVLETIYKMVHLSRIGIALQALSVLLQVVVTRRSGAHDRFYNALYKKILDPELAEVSPKAAALFFHIVHRAMQSDPSVPRAQAFLKRLLQAAMHFPPAKVAGVMIVVSKMLKARAPLLKDGEVGEEAVNGEATGDFLALEVGQKEDGTEQQKKPVGYVPFHRHAGYAGAQFTRKYELFELLHHFHPSVRVFVEQVIKHKTINYYGDPLKDFSLTTFLDRFSFKNPKTPEKTEKSIIFRDNYKPQGSRSLPVHGLTKQNCTEDERFIFEFLEQKRQKKKLFEKKVGDSDDEMDAESDIESISDDEFNDYLDHLGAAGGAKEDDEGDEDEIDFLKELGGELEPQKVSKKGKKMVKASEDDEEVEGEWDSDAELDEDLEMDSDGSISLDEDEMGGDSGDDESVMTFSDDEDDEDEGPRSKKRKTSVSDREFQRKLKEGDMKSLFAAADDFSEMLEESGTSKDHGTSREVFNRDKSSKKQLDWEAKRGIQKGRKGGKPVQKFKNAAKPGRKAFKGPKKAKRFNKRK